MLEYLSEGDLGWPLCANISDPVRASVVCNGPSKILQVLSPKRELAICLDRILQDTAGGCPPLRAESVE